MQRGRNKRVQLNIVDLSPGILTPTDEAFTVDRCKHTHTEQPMVVSLVSTKSWTANSGMASNAKLLLILM